MHKKEVISTEDSEQREAVSYKRSWVTARYPDVMPL
jgi:hypothetical protein